MPRLHDALYHLRVSQEILTQFTTTCAALGEKHGHILRTFMEEWIAEHTTGDKSDDRLEESNRTINND
jgi:hypothetical protein